MSHSLPFCLYVLLITAAWDGAYISVNPLFWNDGTLFLWFLHQKVFYVIFLLYDCDLVWVFALRVAFDTKLRVAVLDHSLRTYYSWIMARFSNERERCFLNRLDFIMRTFKKNNGTLLFVVVEFVRAYACRYYYCNASGKSRQCEALVSYPRVDRRGEGAPSVCTHAEPVCAPTPLARFHGLFLTPHASASSPLTRTFSLFFCFPLWNNARGAVFI